MTDLSSLSHYSVETDVLNGVGTLTFFNPQSNSLPLAQMLEIAGGIEMLGRHPDVKIILIRSKGDKVFCAGASFDELLLLKEPEEAREFFMGFARIILAMRGVRQLVVVRITGKTVGGGMGIAAAADFALATHSALFRLSELSIGLGPFVIGPAVKRKIGLSAFSTMALQPDKWFQASWLIEKGLLSSIHTSVPELDVAISELTGQLAATPSDATASFKKILWQDTLHWETLMTERAELSGQLALSAYTRKKLQEFKSNK